MEMVDPDAIEELVAPTHPDVLRLLGIAHFTDPGQVVRRLVKKNGIPHLWLNGRIRFSLPALKIWAAQQLNASVSAGADKEKAGETSESLATTA